MNNESNSQARLQRGHFTLKSSGRCIVGIYNNRNPTWRPPLLIYIMLCLQVLLYLSLRTSLVVKFVLVIASLCLLKLHIPKDGRHALRYGYKMTKYYSSEFSFSIFDCFAVDTGSCMHMQWLGSRFFKVYRLNSWIICLKLIEIFFFSFLINII